MAHYSVATTKDKLSSLIDKALAGEEVIITRHGKPTVALVVTDGAILESRVDVRAATARLQARIVGKTPLALPPRQFGEWLYQEDDH